MNNTRKYNVESYGVSMNKEKGARPTFHDRDVVHELRIDKKSETGLQTDKEC